MMTVEKIDSLAGLNEYNIFDNQIVIKTKGDPVNSIWAISERTPGRIDVIGYTETPKGISNVPVESFYEGTIEYAEHYETLRLAKKLGGLAA